MRQRSCRHQSAVRNLYAMEYLIALLQPTQDRDGILNRRLIYLHRLEPSLQGGVLLNILPVLIQRRRTDTVQLAAGQHRLQHVAGIHRTVRLTCTDDQMKLINKQNDFAFALAHFLQNSLETFLKFTAILRTSHQSSHIQGKNLFILQSFRNIAPNNPLRKALHSRRLADTRLADQNRIVFCFSRQNANHIPNLRIPSNDGVKFLVSRPFHKILPVFV